MNKREFIVYNKKGGIVKSHATYEEMKQMILDGSGSRYKPLIGGVNHE